MIEFTSDSNAIEGITIDQKPLKDHLEVVGHKDAYEYVLQPVAFHSGIVRTNSAETSAIMTMRQVGSR